MESFASKRDALFASLDDASKELKGTPLDQSGMNNNVLNIIKRSGAGTLDLIHRTASGDVRQYNRRSLQCQDRSLSRMRGKESIFKKPELPISKCLKPRKSPDYQLNPHKWKKYTLSDVDISDQTNNAAAFVFLRAIEEQREKQADVQGVADIPSDCKIEFKKCSKLKRQIKALSNDEVADSQVDKPKHKGSKFLMPEYIVGQCASRKKKKQNVVSGTQNPNKTTSGKQLNLTHLQEYEDDPEDETMD